jgi:glycosyltransferase involved in cell wall biosynthesis
MAPLLLIHAKDVRQFKKSDWKRDGKLSQSKWSRAVELKNKTILLISPERWGVNFLSKHHYACELAKRGNKVFFLNPRTAGIKEVRVTKTAHQNVAVIDSPPGLKGLNRMMRFPALFNFFSRFEVRRILKKINTPDIVWSFDPYRFPNLRLFGATRIIFHPVDFFSSDIDIHCAKSADIIFSVAKPILDRYRRISKSAFLINHGVASAYLLAVPTPKQDTTIRCGYVGNLLYTHLHHENLFTIVSQNPHVEFHFIGPSKANNLGSLDNPDNPIHRLSQFANVRFYGQMETADVARVIQGFDLFLMCYDPETAGKAVSNTHKILEYLSTGKVVVSSRISEYDSTAIGLFEMVQSSSELPKRFKDVVAQLPSFNSPELLMLRKQFARDNGYDKQVDRIESHLNDL